MTYIPIPLIDIYDYPNLEQARWGLGTKLMNIPTENMQAILGQFANNVRGGKLDRRTPIPQLEHPLYYLKAREWEKWRLCYETGERFIDYFLDRYSTRENPQDFIKRKRRTPIPAFAKAAINEIKNSIFQRIGDTVRTGGSESYQKAIVGQLNGVNLHSATMNWFIGHYVLAELLVMQKVGVYVDAPNFGITRADKGNKHPYFYTYRAEDIKNWTYASTDDGTEFSSVLLREYIYRLDPYTGLPIGEEARFRHVYINSDTGRVNIQFYDKTGVMEGPAIELTITKIPFVVFEITESLMKDVANHQIALMNLESSDISYALHSNFPFYVEQFDPLTNNPNIRQAQNAYQDYYAGAVPPKGATVAKVTGMAPGSPTVTPAAEGTNQIVAPTGNLVAPAAGENMDLGATQGRRYPKGMDTPAFINPSPEPLQVSMEKQRALKDDIRSLVHLALSSVQSKAVSAESKLVDREQGLESGLAAIGLELEHGERQLTEYWASYEGSSTPTINYPKHWSLKSSAEIQAENAEWAKLRESVPSLTFKKEVNKIIASTIMGTKLAPDVLDTIYQELDDAKGGSSDPLIIASDVNTGLLGPDTASELRGYPKGEVEAAQASRAERLALIAQAQSTGKAEQTVAGATAVKEDAALPAARGVPDASPDPALEASLEKQGKQGRGNAK